MGADFLQRVEEPLKRSWDRGRLAIGETDLLTRQVVFSGRSVAVEMVQGAALTPGEYLTVEMEGRCLIARRRLTIVARNDNPSEGVVNLLSQYCNVRPGTVSEVHDMADMAEITIKC